ncbi:transposase [Streptomyces sp. 900116325]
MAAAAPGRSGRARRPWRGRLDLGDRRRRLRPGEKAGSLTGRNPVDRGKKGSKLHVRSDAQGLPLALGVSGANVHDSRALLPLVLGIPAIRSGRGPRRRRPGRLRADKAYHCAERLKWLRERGIVPRIARPGIESGGFIDHVAVAALGGRLESGPACCRGGPLPRIRAMPSTM